MVAFQFELSGDGISKRALRFVFLKRFNTLKFDSQGRTASASGRRLRSAPQQQV